MELELIIKGLPDGKSGVLFTTEPKWIEEQKSTDWWTEHIPAYLSFEDGIYWEGKKYSAIENALIESRLEWVERQMEKAWLIDEAEAKEAHYS